MPVTTTISRWTYTGDDSTVAFPYTNRIFDKNDLIVSIDSVTQTVDTDYTVSGVGEDEGGSVTFNTAPASGASVVIIRDVPTTQLASLPLGGTFPSLTVQDALDKLTILIQQIESRESRAIRLQELDPATSINALPLKTALANSCLGFDTNGDPVAAVGTSANLGPVSAYIDTFLPSADAAAAQTILELELARRQVQMKLTTEVFGG
jgi:hypothetical protein